MYPVRIPAPVPALFRGLTWRIPGDACAVHLTFDDGPVPEVTPWVLDVLRAHDAKATFFCVGVNAAAHPQLMDRIRGEGHTVGNHTWSHTDGWRTAHGTYLRDVARCQALTRTALFRPPYGRITPRLTRALRANYRLVMWDVLSGDFDTAIDGERCLHNVIDNVRPGSIVVFHDSVKAWDRLRHALPEALRSLKERGYTFPAIPEDMGVTARSR